MNKEIEPSQKDIIQAYIDDDLCFNPAKLGQEGWYDEVPFEITGNLTTFYYGKDRNGFLRSDLYVDPLIELYGVDPNSIRDMDVMTYTISPTHDEAERLWRRMQ